MNLRCIYCQTPFTLSRVEMLGAIVTMNEKNQNHYDAHCPRCRRANSISRQRMELFFPNWREAAKQQASAPPPTPASSVLKTQPLTKEKRLEASKMTTKKAPAKKAPAKKAPAKASSPKKTPKKPAAKKTTPAKPAAKKAPAKGRKK
ncbi:MAG: hypothetical protein QY332_04970 [Anaerolineales bacterium]|nr:MAG: hypothetical protein QY332_04970 [Anaerolineales bacterium]